VNPEYQDNRGREENQVLMEYLEILDLRALQEIYRPGFRA
jgi:hypothetical protein